MRALGLGEILKHGDVLKLDSGKTVPTLRVGELVDCNDLYYRSEPVPTATRTTKSYLPGPTSLEANATRSPVVLELVRKAIIHRPGTCEEVEQRLGLPHQSVSARIRDLSKRGEIRKSGNYRDTKSGRRAIVWEAGAIV